ncbi:hypothetical protein HanOQP8_Chr16g0632291 [Helianthus annuus]|nr:hypothetical protein HanOQP8_Chr16g0632291 [Helianthus annuus]
MAEVLDSRIHVVNDDDEIISKRMHEINYYSRSEQSDSKEDKDEIYQPPDEWLPITKSRRGNSWTATFHLLSSGIGIQTLSLPIAFLYLGW